MVICLRRQLSVVRCSNDSNRSDGSGRSIVRLQRIRSNRKTISSYLSYLAILNCEVYPTTVSSDLSLLAQASLASNIQNLSCRLLNNALRFVLPKKIKRRE